jgi:DNA-binding NarL/FixJ family response regulator
VLSSSGRGGTGDGAQVRVVLVDDHRLFRTGVRTGLGDAVDVLGEAETVDEAVALVRGPPRRRPARRAHARRRGLAVLAALGQDSPATRFLALSVSDAAADVIAVVRAGARGYVTKNVSPEELLDAVRRVAEGDAVFSPRLAGFVLDAFSARDVPVHDEELDLLTSASATSCG